MPRKSEIVRTYPKGFKPISNDLIAHVSYTTGKPRFYLSVHIRKAYGIKSGDYIGFAYDKERKKLLIDLRATAFYVDKRGYVTSKRFAQELSRQSSSYDGMRVNYVLNPEESDDRFVILDEKWLD